jgi:hypothetical protein
MFATAAVGGVALLVANSGIALAAYGPSASPQGTVPGGFSCVVTSQTAGPAAKHIGPLRLGGLEATIEIRPGTFSGRVQLTMTAPGGENGGCQGGQGVGDGGFRGYRPVGGVGILLQRHGSAYTGKFRRPIVVRMSSPSIGASSLVVVWNGSRFVLAAADHRGGSATTRVFGSGDYAVLTRAPARHLARHLARRRLGRGGAPALQDTGTAGTAGDFFVAALLGSAAGPPPGAGVLLTTRLAAADSSRAIRLP